MHGAFLFSNLRFIRLILKIVFNEKTEFPFILILEMEGEMLNVS